jgi:shikimate kinase
MLTAILMGPPGSGKSSVGKSLAHKLNLNFCDTDLLIEERCNMSISEIFVDKGEPFFREIEKSVVLEQLSSGDGILSLGGGSILDPQIRVALSDSNAPLIFLDVSLSTASPRVGFNRDRPLLLGNPRAKWQELMNARRPIYEELATYTVLTDDLTASQVAQNIIDHLASGVSK